MIEATTAGDMILGLLDALPAGQRMTCGEIALALRGRGVRMPSRVVRRVIASECALPHWPLVAAVSGHGYFVVRDLDAAVKYRDWLLNLAEQAAEKVARFEKKARTLGLQLPRTRRAGR